MAAPEESLEEAKERIKQEMIREQIKKLKEEGKIPPEATKITMRDIAKTSVDHFRKNPFLTLQMARPDVFVKQLKKKEKKQPMLLAMLEYQHAFIELLIHLINCVTDQHLSIVALTEIVKDALNESSHEDLYLEVVPKNVPESDDQSDPQE